MSFLELFIIAIGLSMDALAVSVSIGLTLPKSTLPKSLLVGLYFGVFQGAMPLLGYLIGSGFAKQITAVDHWIAFVLLAFIGAKMVKESLEKETDKPAQLSLGPKRMLPLAVATSIDALAVGVSFSFLQVNIYSSAGLICATTLLLSAAGVKAGNFVGIKFKSKAELFGGIVLILMGVKILLEHLGIISF